MRLTAGLLLALASAAAINLGFLLQHRGLSRLSMPAVRARLHSRPWLGGQALGWLGFASQIVAVSLAPLSLVQAFAAGGLALSVPLAARLFAHRISPGQRMAVLLAAAGLAVLPLGLAAGSEHVRGPALMIALCVAAGAGAAAGLSIPWPAARAMVAGLFYGIADAAIKVITLRWHTGPLLSAWTAIALLGTAAGFLAFQAALRDGNPVSAISLMNSLAALVALACGVLALGESLGRDPLMVALHAGAIVLILSCLPLLASAHHAIAERSPLTRTRQRARDRAPQNQHRPLDPRAQTGSAAPQYVREVEVARQGK